MSSPTAPRPGNSFFTHPATDELVRELHRSKLPQWGIKRATQDLVIRAAAMVAAAHPEEFDQVFDRLVAERENT